VAALVVVLTGLALRAAATAPVLAPRIGEIRIADQALPAVAVLVATIAFESGLDVDVLPESGATEGAETGNSESGSGSRLEHATSVCLFTNDAGEIVETIGIHAFLSLSTSNCALNRTVGV
jgi:hypothetical protein